MNVSSRDFKYIHTSNKINGIIVTWTGEQMERDGVLATIHSGIYQEYNFEMSNQ